MSQQRKPVTRLAARSASTPASKGGSTQSNVRGNWIDKLDRAANRPFMEGDYMPGEIRDRAPEAAQRKTGRRGGGGR